MKDMINARRRTGLTRLVAAAAAFIMLFSGCGLNPGPPDDSSTGTTQPTTSSSTPAYQPGDLTPSPLTIHSAALVDDGEFAYFADPETGFLTAVDLQSGETRTLLETAISSELILSDSRIFFRETASGRICSVLTNGTLYRSGYKMPFESGVMYEGNIYFIENTLSNGDCVLYCYSPLEGEWSTTILTGCERSLSRSTAVFDAGCLYYIQDGAEKDGIIKLSLDTLEKSRIYTSEGKIREILCQSGTLYFRDTASASILSLADGEAGTYISTDAARIFAVLTDGLLYGSIGSGSDNIKMGNADGQETVCMGGEILAYGGSRAVVLRANKKNDRLCLVKYPEDEVQHYIDGTPYLILAGENFVLAVICGEQSRYLFSLADGSVLALDAVPLALTEVELDDYLAASIKERVIPSKEALAAAEPAKLASVFACALAKSDRAAINRMLENSGVWISPYAPLYFKQWTASKLPSAYEIELVPYFENDLAFAGFLPAALRKISVKVGGIEMQLPFQKFLERE